MLMVNTLLDEGDGDVDGDTLQGWSLQETYKITFLYILQQNLRAEKKSLEVVSPEDISMLSSSCV